MAFHIRSPSFILALHICLTGYTDSGVSGCRQSIGFSCCWRRYSRTRPSTDTQLSDPQRDQHITLTRPNTVLLLATVRGGVAYRGLFTGAMADQFRSADGKKDINAMFTLAANSTRQRNDGLPGAEQIPKLENTTHKFLILPPVETEATSDMQ